MAARGGAGRLRRRRRSRRFVWPGWRRGALEAPAVIAAGVVRALAAVRGAARAPARAGAWVRLPPLPGAGLWGVAAEVLLGVAAAESAFSPRDGADGGGGLFQITAPPAEAVAGTRRRLHVEQLDPLNQRHNAFLAAATLHLYLDEMSGDL